MTDQEEALAELYGESAKYSEHRRGDRIRYLNERVTCEGVILWVAAPQEVAGTACPMCYIVEPDGETDTFPHTILPGDVIGLVNGQESTLKKCPFCTGYHSPEEIERCPLNPNR